jgi:bacterial surface protein 26-residue repeat/bacterial surface protein 26-residue repeat/bacterial surface protein 26-residue repeat/bacterial surface protein 26-residue repeat/bacterial surface protein 26-residue repeat/bacterial surface protein 26-residue repeat/bacterial surface protein 26-residue repeat
MPIYINPTKNIKKIFVKVNGQKKNIVSAWVNKEGAPAKVFQYNSSETDPYEVASEGEHNDWRYTLDGANKIITLQAYIPDSVGAIVYANYTVDGEIYKTKLSSNNSFTTSPYCMFKDKQQLQYVEFSKNIDTSDMTGMVQMFYRCYELKHIDFGGLTTSNVTNMSYMFSDCRVLTDLDVSGFDTSNASDMRQMFYNCLALTDLDVSGFDTSNVTNMSQMFNGCTALKRLDVSGFDTSKVTTMQSMFHNCLALTDLDVSGLTTSNVTNMTDMFNNCHELAAIDVSHFNTSKVTMMSSMFKNCSSLSILDLSSFDTRKNSGNSMQYMFSGCSKLGVIYATEGKWIVPSLSKNVFSGCGVNDVTYK